MAAPGSLELIFPHIPKTAGTALRYILYGVYGRNRVATLGMEFPWTRDALDIAALPADTRVLTGHFSFSQVAHIYNPELHRIVTFVREPDSRFASQYFHYKRSDLPDENLSRSVQARLPLIAYLAMGQYNNVMHRQMKGLRLDAWDFVGLYEHFENDVERLAGLFGWDMQTVQSRLDPGLTINRNPDWPPGERTMGKWARMAIAAANRKDHEIYRRVLDLRGAGGRARM